MKEITLAAYRKLARRSYFKNELKEALLHSGFFLGQVEEVIEELAEHGYLNDQEGVTSFINQGIRRGKSPLWIRAQLKKKGVSLPHDWEAYYPQAEREENIRKLVEKSKKDKNKTIGSILRKGYSLDEVLSVINKRC